MKNYTTKPIELPLSTEKEYVLVDVEGYKKAYQLNELIMNECSLTEPFKFDVVSGATGFIDKIKNTSVVSDRYKEHVHFREVIRQPESEVEWSDVDGAIFIPVEFGDTISIVDGDRMIDADLYFAWSNKNIVPISDVTGRDLVMNRHKLCKRKRKPETEAERKERERLEAIEAIYKDMQISGCVNFTKGMAEHLYSNGYRKEQN